MTGYWWHPLTAKTGPVGPNMPPTEECVLAESELALQQMRDRFEAMCRNGWYGPEWQDRARGRKSWVTPCP